MVVQQLVAISVLLEEMSACPSALEAAPIPPFFFFSGPNTHIEEVMATHSIILAWRILWTEEPGGL